MKEVCRDTRFSILSQGPSRGEESGVSAPEKRPLWENNRWHSSHHAGTSTVGPCCLVAGQTCDCCWHRWVSAARELYNCVVHMVPVICSLFGLERGATTSCCWLHSFQNKRDTRRVLFGWKPVLWLYGNRKVYNKQIWCMQKYLWTSDACQIWT